MKLANHRRTVAQYETRRETFEGREHVVVPVIMMMEGVHSGSHGPIFHSITELGKFTDAWNGIPVTVNHPEQDGNFVSANSPEVLERSVGRVFNTRVEANKLKAEAWLDVAVLTENFPEVLSYIETNRPLDVSVGVFSDEEPIDGTYNNETYQAVARNHRPDHLALLPGGTGACSWDDGCGVRTNMKGGTMKIDELKLDSIKQEGLTLRKADGFTVNVIGFNETGMKIQRKLDRMDNETSVHYLQEVFPDYFIYQVRYRDGEKDDELYRQTYAVNGEGGVTLSGEPEKVRKEINYLLTQKISKPMTKVEKPCCEERVDALIANQLTHFTDENREWLLALNSEQLDLLEPIAPEPIEEPEPPTVNREQAIEVLRETLRTPEDFLAVLPEEMRDQMRSGLNLHKARKSDLVKHILANAEKDAWTEDELNALDSTMLEKIAKSTKSPVDYSGNGSRGTIETNDSEPPLFPAGVKPEEK